MAAQGGGVIVYLRPAGSLRACGLPESDSPATDLTSETVAWILRDLGVYTIRLSEETPGFGMVMFGDTRIRSARGRLRNSMTQHDGEVSR